MGKCVILGYKRGVIDRNKKPKPVWSNMQNNSVRLWLISQFSWQKKIPFSCFCSVDFLNTVKSLLLWFLSDFVWHSNSCMGWWHYRCRPPETHLRSGLYEGMCHSQMKRMGWFAHSPAVWLNVVESHHPQLDDPQVSCCRYWMWIWTRSSGHQRGRLWIGGM